MNYLLFFALLNFFLAQSCTHEKTKGKRSSRGNNDVTAASSNGTQEATETNPQTTTIEKDDGTSSTSSEEDFRSNLVYYSHLFHDNQDESEGDCSSKWNDALLLTASDDALEINVKIDSCEDSYTDEATNEITKYKYENVIQTFKFSCTGGTLNKITKEDIIQATDSDGLFLSHCPDSNTLKQQYSVQENEKFVVSKADGETISETSYEYLSTLSNGDGGACSWKIADGIAKVEQCTINETSNCTSEEENGRKVDCQDLSSSIKVKYVGIMRPAEITDAKWYSGGVVELETEDWKGKVTFATDILGSTSPSYSYSNKAGTEEKSGLITDIENESNGSSTNDGLSIENAIKIDETTEFLGVQKEYEIISQKYGEKHVGWNMLDCSVIKSGDKIYDQLHIEIISSLSQKQELDYYFDITEFYGKY